MNLLTSLRRLTFFQALLLLVIVIVSTLLLEPLALESYGITLTRVNDIAMVAIGLSFVIFLGEIDLSVGSTMAVGGVVAATFSDNLPVGILAGLAAGLTVGAINGMLVVVLGIHSFIATLGTMTVLAGIALIISGGNPVSIADFGATIFVSDALFGQMTFASVVTSILVAAAVFWLNFFRSGRMLFVIGGNESAARAAGVNVAINRFVAFLLCGLTASIAGVLSTLQVGSASPTMGSSVLLMAIASAVLGGGVLTGGRGSVIGAIFGALALGVMRSALELAGVATTVEQILVGSILFVTVVSSARSRDARVGRRFLGSILRHRTALPTS